jgi:TPR repeat protein
LGAHGKIFISYRREDAPGDARGICDRLGRSFGVGNVFMDVDRLLAGQRFDRELDKALAQCDVLIAVIGARWMELLSDYAQQNKRDYVRDEIAAALQRDIIVIPVMIGREANMPPLPLAQNLPENIRDLVLYQKHNIAHETFGRDAADLVASLRLVLRARRGPRPWRAIAAAAVVALVLAGAAIGYWMDMLPRSRPHGPPADVAANSATSVPMNSDGAAKKAEEARQQEAARKAEADAQLAAEAARKKAEADAKAADDAAKAKAAEEQATRQAADAEAARKKAEADAKAADDAARKKAAEEQAAAAEAARKADQQAKLAIVTDCDRLAAWPYDNDRPAGVDGVLETAKIEAGAGAACDDAMRRYPETARFVYQAGRAAIGRRDYPKAIEFFRSASAKGSVAALFGLGVIYHEGWGVARDYAEARKWYEQAAARGSTPAMSNLGKLYERGEGVPQDYAEARRWYEKGAALGGAVPLSNLGWLYENGHGGPQDYAVARRMYERGVGLGSPLAMRHLGLLYMKGRGVPQDYTQGRNLFLKAAALDDSGAMIGLGNAYYYGRGVATDYVQARNWYEKAAALGNSEAMNNLGSMYYRGDGVASDDVAARGWFQKAADLGDTNAMLGLGLFYEDGRGGLPKSRDQARQWYQKASDGGNEFAKTRLKYLK